MEVVNSCKRQKIDNNNNNDPVQNHQQNDDSHLYADDNNNNNNNNPNSNSNNNNINKIKENKPKSPEEEKIMANLKSTMGTCDNVSDRYEKVGRIGKGTYGIVYKAKDLQASKNKNKNNNNNDNNNSHNFVALKRCIPHYESSDGFPLTTLREIHALRVCQSHANIVSLHNVCVSKQGVFLVLEYCDSDLAQIIDQYYHSYRKSPFSKSQVKRLIQQLCNALEFIHDHHFIHRDVKLSNLLYKQGNLQLADFGLARPNSSTQQKLLTSQVVSLWYRPPELLWLINNTNYSYEIDMWATGCVFGELLQGYPVWDGRTELDQMEQIQCSLGIPPQNIYGNKNKNNNIDNNNNDKTGGDLSSSSSSSLSLSQSKCLKKKGKKRQRSSKLLLLDHFSYLTCHGLTLLTQLVHYDPKQRWTAKQALDSPYFTKELPHPTEAKYMPKF